MVSDVLRMAHSSQPCSRQLPHYTRLGGEMAAEQMTLSRVLARQPSVEAQGIQVWMEARECSLYAASQPTSPWWDLKYVSLD